MKIVILSNLVLAFLVAQSSFARNLGVLNDNQKPRDLIPADEFTNNSDDNSSNDSLRSDARGYYGYGYGHGYGHYHNYYPYYYYPYYNYCPYYYNGYCYYYDQEDTENSSSAPLDRSRIPSNQLQSNLNISQMPVVCFSSDSAGNWFSNADLSPNAASVQDEVNQECVANGGQCSLNLGCAIATHEHQ